MYNILKSSGSLKQEVKCKINRFSYNFIYGNIRINFPSGFDLAQPMTPAQRRVVRRYIQSCARNGRNSFYVTIFKEGKTQKYFEYKMFYADDVDNIMQDIDDYFDSYK